ncbi:MAG: hypothetical protein BWY95_02399 [Bacteroidetes bacterium ADurb.BinA104]|nr:MAG: hypothetical protein BWY95_02399 [Bacteroidetes bacterium ADurb.BinA104]
MPSIVAEATADSVVKLPSYSSAPHEPHAGSVARHWRISAQSEVNVPFVPLNPIRPPESTVTKFVVCVATTVSFNTAITLVDALRLTSSIFEPDILLLTSVSVAAPQSVLYVRRENFIVPVSKLPSP